jgi:unsaturated chondroitin disaccharide hydrolase
MKKLFILLILGGSMTACQQNPLVGKEAKSELNAQLDNAITRAGEQYHYMMEILPENRFPKTYHAKEDRLETSGSEWWCSGFYPGSLLYLYDKKGEETLKTEARRIMEVLEKEQYNTSTHDLGFMMFCSFGNALKLAPRDGDRDILVQSAKSLSTRFDETTGVIKSWDSKEGDFLVIIDNMMNLELLFWATQETGDSTYYDIAITHADNTTKNHFRDDYSSYHVVNYNPRTGEVNEKRTAQGYADDSAWARGQTWGLYGYIVMYRFTKDQKYLDQAVNIAEFILNHPNMPKDKIPYWDFDAPNIPDALRDSSAGAILASALLELSGYVEGDKSKRYIRDAETMLASLASPTYLAEPRTNGGFLLKHGVGHIPENFEVDVPLTYGDYYFIEAIRRYKALK